MAQTVKIILTDDLDGGEATETVRFALDGGQYEIDLSSENANQLRETIRPYVRTARRLKGKRANKRQSSTQSQSARSTEVKKIRTWAQGQGYELSNYGRVPTSIRDAYYESHK